MMLLRPLIPTSLAVISIPLSRWKLGLMGGLAFIVLLVLRALMRAASTAISLSWISVRGAGTRLNFLGGEAVATVERE